MIQPATYMKIIIEMIKKNFRNILRSKSSALIILLGPFLIIFLIGAAFNTTGLHNVKVSIYAMGESEVLDEVTSSLKNNDFSVLYANTEPECTGMVENGQSHICITFPADLSPEALEREIIFHVDYSKVNLVFTILNVITHEVEDISTDLSIEYTRLLIEEMNRTSGAITEKSVLIGDLATSAQEMKDSLTLLNTELDAIAVNQEEFGISDIETYIDDGNAQLEEFETLADDTLGLGLELLDDLDITLVEFEDDLDEQLELVDEFEMTLLEYKALACIYDWTTIEGLEFDPCAEVEEVETMLNDAVEQAEAMEDSFDLIESDMDLIRDELETADEEQQVLLDDAAANLGDLEVELDASIAKIDEIATQRDQVVGDLDLLIVTLDENIATIGDVQYSIEEISDGLANAEINDPEHVVDPILTRIKPLLEKKSYLDYTMPALIVLVVMFMSILLSSTIVMTEKHSRAYFRNYITPVPDVTFLLSIYLTNIFIVMMQAMILFVIAQLAFGVSIFSNFMSIFIATIFIATIFILLGMSIGYLFVSEETGTLAAISLSSVFLLFSSFLIPIESLSKTIGSVAVYNPFVVSESVLRQLLIFGNTIFSAPSEMFMLLLYVAILSGVLYTCEMIDKRRLR